SISTISSSSRPAYPLIIPLTFSPLLMATRTTARIAAFMPGASPPLVSTPMVLIAFAIAIYLLQCSSRHFPAPEQMIFLILYLNQRYFNAFHASLQGLFHKFDIFLTNSSLPDKALFSLLHFSYLEAPILPGNVNV